MWIDSAEQNKTTDTTITTATTKSFDRPRQRFHSCWSWIYATTGFYLGLYVEWRKLGGVHPLRHYPFHAPFPDHPIIQIRSLGERCNLSKRRVQQTNVFSCSFRSGTDLISLLILLLLLFFFFLMGRSLQNSLRLRHTVSNLIGVIFGRSVLQVNTRRLSETDFRFNVTVSRWRPLRHFTLQSDATW